MSYTTPRTWVTGEVVTAAELNANVRDNVSFLANKPTCRAYNSANVTITSGTQTVIPLNSERFKTASGMHSTSVSPSHMIAPVAGKYLMIGHVEWAPNATGRRIAYIRINGATFIAEVEAPPSSTGDSNLAITAMWDMAANDYAELLVYQSSGGSLDVLASSAVSPEFSLTWITL